MGAALAGLPMRTWMLFCAASSRLETKSAIDRQTWESEETGSVMDHKLRR